MIIYKAENKINGKIYIGQTKYGMNARIYAHIKENRFYFQKALNKYGIQSFEISVIDEADSKLVLNEKEMYWVNYYNCLAPRGYNCTSGGGGMSDPPEVTREKLKKRKNFLGKHHSEKTKNKIRKALLGKPRSEEFIEKHRNHHPSEETIQKMKSVKRSEEFKQRVKEVHTGRHHTEATKQKIRDANLGKKSWNKGNRGLCSEETLSKMRQPHKKNRSLI